MILVIDVGNSSMVWALSDNSSLGRQWRLPTFTDADVAYYQKECGDYISSEIEQVVIASVVPGVNDGLERYCTDVLGAHILWATHDTVPLEIALPHPEEVGADRLIDAYAAYRIYKEDCIIVDFGTATTCELVTKDGVYKGGTISPGIDLSLKALHMGTAKLPEIELTKPDNVIGTSTVEAIESGVYWGYVGLVEGLINRIKASYGKSCKVIATGGKASLFAEQVEGIDVVDEDLTVKGLRCLGLVDSGR